MIELAIDQGKLTLRQKRTDQDKAYFLSAIVAVPWCVKKEMSEQIFENVFLFQGACPTLKIITHSNKLRISFTLSHSNDTQCSFSSSTVSVSNCINRSVNSSHFDNTYKRGLIG